MMLPSFLKIHCMWCPLFIIFHLSFSNFLLQSGVGFYSYTKYAAILCSLSFWDIAVNCIGTNDFLIQGGFMANGQLFEANRQ